MSFFIKYIYFNYLISWDYVSTGIYNEKMKIKLVSISLGTSLQ